MGNCTGSSGEPQRACAQNITSDTGHHSAPTRSVLSSIWRLVGRGIMQNRMPLLLPRRAVTPSPLCAPPDVRHVRRKGERQQQGRCIYPDE